MPCRVLVVEDEPAIADAIEYALRSDGLAVERVGTLAAARAALARQPPDLVVLDVGLPDGSGFDLCRELRRASLLPVLFLTARGDEIDRVVGLELGADDYVVKPFSPRELSARVRAILRRAGAPADRAGRGALAIDEAALSASWKGAHLGLTRYQFRLLAVLAAQPGRVFSRSELLDQVWEDPGATVDRGVDSLVKALRARFKAVDADADVIHTHRGDGYSWRGGP
jgi:two-component system catabolic regulation response regulator CreB